MILIEGLKHPISHTLFQILMNYENSVSGEEKLIKEYINFSMDSFLEQIKGHTKEEVIKGFNDLIDQVISDEKNAGKLNVSCKKGCNHCCSINVDIYEVEADLILLYLGEQGKYKEVNWNQIEGQIGLELETRWMSKFRRCAFLNTEGNCGIYDVRPINCKKFFVVSEPEKCNTDNGIGGMIQIQTIIDVEIICSVLDLILKKGLMQDILITKRIRNGKSGN